MRMRYASCRSISFLFHGCKGVSQNASPPQEPYLNSASSRSCSFLYLDFIFINDTIGTPGGRKTHSKIRRVDWIALNAGYAGSVGMRAEIPRGVWNAYCPFPLSKLDRAAGWRVFPFARNYLPSANHPTERWPYPASRPPASHPYPGAACPPCG